MNTVGKTNTSRYSPLLCTYISKPCIVTNSELFLAFVTPKNNQKYGHFL